MSAKELLINTLKKEREARKAAKNHSPSSVVFQPLLLIGSKYNQVLVNLARENNEINLNLIDFSKISEGEKTSGKWIEKELERISNQSQSEFSLICFLNLNEISGTALEKSLLPFFDPHQNTQHQGIDLSNFILLATSSASLEKLSPPLISRLKCVNREEIKLPKTFLDKHFSSILAGSIFLVLIGLLLLFWPAAKKIKSKNLVISTL